MQSSTTGHAFHSLDLKEYKLRIPDVYKDVMFP